MTVRCVFCAMILFFKKFLTEYFAILMNYDGFFVLPYRAIISFYCTTDSFTNLMIC